MSLEMVTRKFILTFDGVFDPKVRIGTNVEVGTLLGVGQRYRVLQEIPMLAINAILVDDGVYVNKGESLASSSSILEKKIWTADVEGLARITDGSIQIVDIEDNYKYTSFVRGRVSYAGPDKIVIDAKYYKIWAFASLGDTVKGVLEFIDNDSGLITSKDIPESLEGKVVFINGFLTRQIIIKAINARALGIIGISIDYNEYKELGALLKYINLGVLQGFGQFIKTSPLVDMFRNYNRHYVEIDFSEEFIYLPVRHIVSIPKQYWLFSGMSWACPITVNYKQSLITKDNESGVMINIKQNSKYQDLTVDISEILVFN